jgi:hypothetical protein
MPLVSVTRVRLRSIRFVLPFFVLSTRSQTQLRTAAGFLGGALLADRHWTFWTMSLWSDAAAMRAYILNGSHKTAMPKLLNWGDEASVVHWEQAEAVLPSWAQAEQRMRSEGRASKLRYPSPRHAALGFAPPRTTRGTVLKPANR